MKIELVLLGLIAVVLIVDFILRGIKKKDTTEKGVEKFEGAFNENKKQSKFNYILDRKRNILTFILLVMLVKPIFHYVFVEEKGEISENVVIVGLGERNIYLKSKEGKLYESKLSSNDRSLLRFNSVKRIFDRGDYSTGNCFDCSIEFEKKRFLKMGEDFRRDGFFNKNGVELLYNLESRQYYYFSRANPTLKSYYTKYYKSKPYFFAISLGGLLILVILFNDKIKAR